MKFSFLAGLDFAKWQEEDVLKALKRLGYDGVEWTLAHFNPRNRPPERLADVVRMTKDHGLEVSEVVVQQNYVWLEEGKRRDAVALTQECIEVCGGLGVRCINVFTGPPPWNPQAPRVGKDIKEGDAWGLVFKAFDEILPHAEKHKVHLAVEGVWGMLAHDFYTSRFLVDRYGSEYLGVNLDPSHGILYGNMDVGWIVKEWGKRIKHVHLKDCVGTPERFHFPLLGEGLVDWSAFFKPLNEIGYQGFCSVEFESFAYYKKVLESDPVEAARISMDAVRKLAGLPREKG
jgi:sugar phosphate isomerase/epimerase